MTDQRTRQEKKQIRRNLKGLLTKAFRYGQLNGVEVGLYIFYTNKNKLVWYESEGYVLQDQIQNKVGPITSYKIISNTMIEESEFNGALWA